MSRSVSSGQTKKLVQYCTEGNYDEAKRILNARLAATPAASSCLRMAVDSDNLKLARLLLEAGAKELLNDGAEVPLTWVACRHRNLPMLKMLVEAGIDIHYQIDGWQAIHAACKMGVLHSGSEDQDDSSTNKHSDTSSTDESTGGLNDDSSSDGDSNSSSTSSSASTRRRKSKKKRRKAASNTPDHYTKGSSWPFVETLLEAGADVNAVTDNHETPLLLASRAGDALAVEILLLAGADPDVFTTWNALHIAAQHNFVDVIEKILESESFDLDVRTRDVKKWTAFHIAAAEGHGSVVNVLLKTTANPSLPSGDAQAQSPLHVAIENNHPAIVDMILTKTGYPDPTDADGWTPLHLACYQGNATIVQILRNHSASLEARTTCSDRWLPLHLSTHRNRVVQILAPRRKVTDEMTCSPRDRQAQAAIDLQNAHGLTALQSATINGHVMGAITLINRGADITVLDPATGQSLLHLACKFGHTLVAETLILKAGVDLSPLDREHKTPLHLAIAGNHIQTVVLLIRSGASIDSQALSIAFEKGPEVFLTLLSHDLENLLPESLRSLPQTNFSELATCAGWHAFALEIERALVEID